MECFWTKEGIDLFSDPEGGVLNFVSCPHWQNFNKCYKKAVFIKKNN